MPASHKKWSAPTRALKQHSPAGARWAVTQFHQIEKMNHRESSIVGGNPIPVKLVISAGSKEE
jgi:hypothetical protein